MALQFICQSFSYFVHIYFIYIKKSLTELELFMRYIKTTKLLNSICKLVIWRSFMYVKIKNNFN